MTTDTKNIVIWTTGITVTLVLLWLVWDTQPQSQSTNRHTPRPQPKTNNHYIPPPQANNHSIPQSQAINRCIPPRQTTLQRFKTIAWDLCVLAASVIGRVVRFAANLRTLTQGWLESLLPW